MKRNFKYEADEPMSDLITAHYSVLLAMSRFGIALGFGEKTIGEVCRDNGVDTETFLAVINTMLDLGDLPELGRSSVEPLVNYLHNSHDYFLGYRLPNIRQKLTEAIGDKTDLSRAIIDYFDQYVAEVRKHMAYEEKKVFPYIRSIMAGQNGGNYNIGIFSRKHYQVEARLIEFKNIIIKYYPSGSTNDINSVLFDIFSCERDLATHNEIEDNLLVPAIERLEQNRDKK